MFKKRFANGRKPKPVQLHRPDKESIDEFIARGGTITRVPIGASWESLDWRALDGSGRVDSHNDYGGKVAYSITDIPEDERRIENPLTYRYAKVTGFLS